jgi:hypothetical protein
MDDATFTFGDPFRGEDARLAVRYMVRALTTTTVGDMMYIRAGLPQQDPAPDGEEWPSGRRTLRQAEDLGPPGDPPGRVWNVVRPTDSIPR